MAPTPQEIINDASLSDAPEVIDASNIENNTGVNIVDYQESGSVEKAGNRVLEVFLIILVVAAVIGIAAYLFTLLRKKADEPEEENEKDAEKGENEAGNEESGEAKGSEEVKEEEAKPLAENAGDENKE